MRLRHILFVLLVLTAQIPVAGLGLWTRGHIISSEIDDVSDRHLLIAQNMAVTLARYHGDLITAFNLASAVHIGVPLSQQTATLFDKLGMNTLCAFSMTAPVKLLKAEGPEAAKCAALMEPGTFRFLSANALSKNATISSLHKVAGGQAYLFAVSKRSGILRVGAIDPLFFRKLAAQVRFGTLGHAVIVDQAGQVLAHPKKEWELDARPLADVQIVRAMLRGETGVMRFNSPSMKGEMIAGFSGVEGAGWGVMIPQPFSELNLKAYEAVQPIYLIIAIGLFVAAATAVYLAQIVARPLENITKLARNAKSVAELSELPEIKGYLAPAEPREIVTAYNGMVRAIRDSETKVRAQAYVDSLTGILNRRAFNEATDKLFTALQGKKGSSLLFFFDLDGFKTINDNHGHAVGDLVLRETSKRTIELCKEYFQIERVYNPLLDETANINIQSLPIFARMGGDEFVLVIPQAGSLKNRTEFAHRLTECLLQPYILENQTLKAGASIGCAVFPEGKDNMEAVLLRADAGLYHAKARGKGQFCFYAPEKGVRSIVEIRREVAFAIADNQMILHYQPKVDAQTGEVNSVEALVRWKHPVLGLQSPISFIPQIEESDEICALGEWVLRQVSNDLVRWNAQNRKMNVALNIGARHLAAPTFPERALQIVNSAGIDPRQIDLEITEEIAMRQDDNASGVIDKLKTIGFGVALDDYGRGYSNLSRLAEVKVDVIKIDRSLIINVEKHERTRKVVAATIAMANALECRVVAEGIEEASHAALLRKLGCHELQGYFFAMPMVIEDLNDWLAERETNPVSDLRKLISGAI